MRFNNGGIHAVPEFSTVFQADSGEFNGQKPKAIGSWIPAGSEQQYLAIISSDSNAADNITILRIDGSFSDDDDYDEVTNALVAQNFDFKAKPDLFVWNEVLVVNTGNSAPQYMTSSPEAGDSLTTFPNWFGANQYAETVKPFGPNLVAMNFVNTQGTPATTDDTYFRVDISLSSTRSTGGTLTNIEWTSSTTNDADSNVISGTPGRIIDGLEMQERFMIYKSDSIIGVSSTGQLTLPYVYDTVSTEDGLLTKGAVASFNQGYHFMVGNHGIYIHDGDQMWNNISKNRVEEFFFGDLGEADRTFVDHWVEQKEMRIYYSSKSNTGDGCDKYLSYNYQTDVWNPVTEGNQLTSTTDGTINGVTTKYGVSPADTGAIRALSTVAYKTGGYLQKNDIKGDSVSLVKSSETVFPTCEHTIGIGLDGTYFKTDTPSFLVRQYDPTTRNEMEFHSSGYYMHMRLEQSGATDPNITALELEWDINGDK